MIKDIAYVKDKYGEEMAHFVRDNFASLLETDGLLPKLIDNNFAHNKFLYHDLAYNNLLIDFKNYIYSLTDVKQSNVKSDKNPFELMDMAGYKLYECKCDDDIEAFRPFYEPNELICTFKSNRLKTCYVFFAIKKDLNNIKRSLNPFRDDVYGTSVISIQFTKGDVNNLSIKNRYNHTVINPDATFSNNLEKIIPGLTDSFTRNYNLNIISDKDKLDISHLNYKKANDNKFYPFNYVINNICYGPNNIIIDNGNVIDKYSDRAKYIVMDYFILDLEKKKIFRYDDKINDGFINSFSDINRIDIKKDKEFKTIDIKTIDNEIRIKIDKHNRIISYENKNEEIIENNFLFYNKTLKEIKLDNVKYIGNSFLWSNNTLEKISLPNVLEIESSFLYSNKILNEINIPSIKYICDSFLCHNEGLKNINLDSIQIIGSDFLATNTILENINLSNVQTIYDRFLFMNKNLRKIKLNNIKKIGDNFLENNQDLDYLYAPKLEEVGNSFLCNNLRLEKLELNNLKKINNFFLNNNYILSELIIPKVEYIGNSFMTNNNNLTSIDLNSAWEIGSYFLYNNKVLDKIKLNNVRYIGNVFLVNNMNLRRLFVPNLIKLMDDFLISNEKMLIFNAPNLKIIGNNFLYNNKNLLVLSLNELMEIGDDFMVCNNNLRGFDAVKLISVGDNFLYSNTNLKHYKAPNIENKGSNYLVSNPRIRHLCKVKVGVNNG